MDEVVLRPLFRLAKVDIFTESRVFGRDFDRFFLESLSLGLFIIVLSYLSALITITAV